MSERSNLTTRQTPPSGKIEVAPRAIASIAAHAAVQIDGIAGLVAPTNHVNGIQVLRQQEAHRGIEVHLFREEIIIDLFVVMIYGAHITDVARRVQERVRDAVERALSMPITHVNVRVQGLR